MISILQSRAQTAGVVDADVRAALNTAAGGTPALLLIESEPSMNA